MQIPPYFVAFVAPLLVGTLVVGCAAEEQAEERPQSDLEPMALDGLTARLSRFSTECSQRVFDGVLAEIGSDMEFPSEAVAKLMPPCEESVSPLVDVYFVDGSLILDFRNVASPGRFRSVQFDGYEVAIDRECGDPVVAAVRLDAQSSSLDMPAHRIESHLDRIELNFAGMAFDADSFLKLDLEIVDVRCGSL